MKTFVKRHTSMGLREAVRLLRLELSLLARHQRAVRTARAMVGPMKVQLGCGPHRKQGWVNVDAFDPAADLQLDLREDLPFRDGSVTVIYSEHFFEHLDYPRDVQHLLREARRVLVPGGRFSVGVPRIEHALRAYVNDDRDYFDRVRGTYHPSWARTPAQQINYVFRQDGEHRFAYDLETLTVVLQEAGFTDVAEREWDGTLDAESRIGSLYVDAVNPG